MSTEDTTTGTSETICDLKRCYQWHDFADKPDDVFIVGKNISKNLQVVK